MAKLNISQFDTRSTKTPCTAPLKGMVENSTGGYTFSLDSWGQFQRFLILGTEGGTFYVAEQDLLKRSHSTAINCIKADGVRAVTTIVDVSMGGRAYRNEPAIFALALCFTHGDNKCKQVAAEALPNVCRIGTHLFHFCAYINAMRGWGSGLRRAVSR